MEWRFDVGRLNWRGKNRLCAFEELFWHLPGGIGEIEKCLNHDSIRYQGLNLCFVPLKYKSVKLRTRLWHWAFVNKILIEISQINFCNKHCLIPNWYDVIKIVLGPILDLKPLLSSVRAGKEKTNWCTRIWYDKFIIWLSQGCFGSTLLLLQHIRNWSLRINGCIS
jgi:hypothetical protein